MKLEGLVLLLVLALGCTAGGGADAAVGPDAVGADAAAADAGPTSPCTPGAHDARIFVVSDDATLFAYDPLARTFEHVLGPVCATTGSPYSMAVDSRGRAWILYAETRRMLTIDVNALAACEDSGYLPTDPALPLFGMSFLRRGPTTSLYAHSYDGEGPFAEGPGLGVLGIIEGDPPRMRRLGTIDYDGGELAGTGDGRLFAFAGASTPALVEYDPSDGSVLETHPLALRKTNASAVAFFGGDIYFFTEAPPAACDACFELECADDHAACLADEACAAHLACAIERGRVQDECGGGVGEAMLECLGRCSSACLESSRVRVSRVTRLDWDESDGAGRALTVEVAAAPMRVVGAGTSPCVPTVPF